MNTAQPINAITPSAPLAGYPDVLYATPMAYRDNRRTFLSGDTHGDFRSIIAFCDAQNTDPDDLIIVLGDAGVNYYGDQRDTKLKLLLEKLPVSFLFIHGNHEMRPQTVAGYHETEWREGHVFIQDEYPSLAFAKDGEIYRIAGKDCLVIGGAYSVDKYHRLARGWNWWDDEQPDEPIKSQITQTLWRRKNKIDIVLSHTCPAKYLPTEVFLDFIDQRTVDHATEDWLDTIEERVTYQRWYCGHYHTDKIIDHIRFLYEDIVELKGVELKW